MAKWRVYGSVPVSVVMTVEAENEQEAIDVAYENFPGMSNYAGNGGLDQIVGLNDRSVSLDAGYGEGIEFTEAEPDLRGA